MCREEFGRLARDLGRLYREPTGGAAIYRARATAASDDVSTQILRSVDIESEGPDLQVRRISACRHRRVETAPYLRLFEKDGPRRVAYFVDDKAHPQQMTRTIERAVLELLDGSIPPVGSRPSLGIPDDGPALAAVTVAPGQELPAESRLRLSRPLDCCHAAIFSPTAPTSQIMRKITLCPCRLTIFWLVWYEFGAKK
jgi:hypothetical protein